MNTARAAQSFQIKPLPGPRTLVLTHLREENSHNTRVCKRMWQVNDLVFSGSPFDHRLYLQETSADFLPGVDLDLRRDDKVYSSTGALSDALPPKIYESGLDIFVPASERKFADRGRQVFFLGGGNLSVCLRSTFESLVKIKVAQGENLQAIIPIPLIYDAKTTGKQDYSLYPSAYQKVLEENVRYLGYRVTLDSRVLEEQTSASAAVELHWFSNVVAMFASPFFPELQADPNALLRVKDYFRHI